VLLLTAAGFAAAITWFRDARPALIPQGFMFGGTIAGVSAAAVGLGFSCSPLMLATGAMVGLPRRRGAAAGRDHRPGRARALRLVNTGIAAKRGASAPSTSGWSGRPSASCSPGASCPLLLDGGAILRAFRYLAVLGRRPPEPRPAR
jgi:hypothetical protein